MDSRTLLARARYTTIASRKRPRPLSVEAKRVFRALVCTLIALLIGASFLFFFQTNSVAQKGYQLRQMEIQNSSLRTENEALKQKVLEALSFKNLSKDVTVKKMESPARTLFVPRRSEKVGKAL